MQSIQIRQSQSKTTPAPAAWGQRLLGGWSLQTTVCLASNSYLLLSSWNSEVYQTISNFRVVMEHYTFASPCEIHHNRRNIIIRSARKVGTFCCFFMGLLFELQAERSQVACRVAWPLNLRVSLSLCNQQAIQWPIVHMFWMCLCVCPGRRPEPPMIKIASSYLQLSLYTFMYVHFFYTKTHSL